MKEIRDKPPKNRKTTSLAFTPLKMKKKIQTKTLLNPDFNLILKKIKPLKKKKKIKEYLRKLK